jgi:hypothetical protein
MNKIIVTGNDKSLRRLVRLVGRLKGITMTDESGEVISKQKKGVYVHTDEGNTDLIEEVVEDEKLETEETTEVKIKKPKKAK